jgi:hypothetical protein
MYVTEGSGDSNWTTLYTLPPTAKMLQAVQHTAVSTAAAAQHAK